MSESHGYKLWKFVAYTNGKGEEELLEYKEAKDERTEEEKHDERDRMCKELAEQQSRQLPGVEIAVFCYNYNELYSYIEEFYSAKDGCVIHQHVDAGLVEIMSCGYFDGMDWVKSYGEALLHPLDFLAEIIKRARKGDDYCPLYATRMMLYGNTAHYFSLIEPSDKEWLMKQAEEHNDIGAIYCLLFGMNNRFQYWNETFVDEDTHEEVTLLRYDPLEGSTFEKHEGEEARLVQIIIDESYQYPADEIMKVFRLVPNNIELLHICIEKGDKDAAEELGYKYAKGDEKNGIFIDLKKAKEYYDKAGVVLDPDEVEDEEDDPQEYDYTLQGNVATINGIRKTIDDLCRDYGTPDNELGLYVPMSVLMKLLVGSIAYCGNILSMEQPSPDRLFIHAEANNGYPLLYALRQCFDNLEITMKEMDI